VLYIMVIYEDMPTHVLHLILSFLSRAFTLPRLLITIPRLIIYKDDLIIILSLPSPLPWRWLPTCPRSITSPRLVPRRRILP
jgi:hypothetical protein